LDSWGRNWNNIWILNRDRMIPKKYKGAVMKVVIFDGLRVYTVYFIYLNAFVTKFHLWWYDCTSDRQTGEVYLILCKTGGRFPRKMSWLEFRYQRLWKMLYYYCCDLCRWKVRTDKCNIQKVIICDYEFINAHGKYFVYPLGINSASLERLFLFFKIFVS